MGSGGVAGWGLFCVRGAGWCLSPEELPRVTGGDPRPSERLRGALCVLGRGPGRAPGAAGGGRRVPAGSRRKPGGCETWVLASVPAGSQHPTGPSLVYPVGVLPGDRDFLFVLVFLLIFCW